jgi:hypothetical protein
MTGKVMSHHAVQPRHMSAFRETRLSLPTRVTGSLCLWDQDGEDRERGER